MNEHRRKSIKSLSVADAAYLAGLIDGEGSISVSYRRHTGNKRNTFILQVMVCNTCFLVIDWCKKTTGLGCLYQRPPKPRCRDIYQWITAAYASEQVLRTVQPYMKIKSEHVAIVLALREIKQTRPYSVIPQEDVIRGLALKTELQRLNGGPKPRLAKSG